MKRWNLWIIVWAGMFAGVASAELSSEQFRRETLAAIHDGTASIAVSRFSSVLSDQLDSTLRLRRDQLANLAVAADCIGYMKLTEKAQPVPETAQWIFDSEKRLQLLVEIIHPSDNLKQCFSILDRLVMHDPEGRGDFFELMLALSVVWDRPRRPLTHYQMGDEILPYGAALLRRYDYFKTLYAEGDAKISYQELGADELIFVVETPVPLSELEWARENEEGQLEDWGDKFSDIEYDHDRLRIGQYDWPRGKYELNTIKEEGGICVDQAYYAVMTARAFGIPAIYFHAKGKSGGHAWFSFMKAPGEWAFDIGRYENESYTTGFAINPQTNKKMTDHDVAYTCEKSQRAKNFAQAKAYVAIAEVLENDPKNALRCAREARKLAERYLRPWQIEIRALIEAEEYRRLPDLFSEQRHVFCDHPDILVESAKTIDVALRAAGWDKEADQLQRGLAREVDTSRDDLARFLGQDKIDKLVEAGNIKKARREMESLLDEHIEEGSKTFSLIQNYLKITKGSDQGRHAARFLEGYVDDLLKATSFSPGYKRILLLYLAQAYEQAGDEKMRRKTEQRIN